MNDLPILWRNLCAELAIQPCDKIFQSLSSAYSEPHRAYHTLQHISECLELLDWADEQIRIQDRYLIAAALWFHDVVYDTRREDNELKSAGLAHSILSSVGLDKQRCDRVRQLVLATDHSKTPQTNAEEWIVDIDLAILGAETIRFEKYEKQIRQEYDWVPETTYRHKRRQVLKSFLDSPHIYNSKLFRDRFDVQARKNLESLGTHGQFEE